MGKIVEVPSDLLRNHLDLLLRSGIMFTDVDGLLRSIDSLRTLLDAASPKVCECPPGTRNITQGGHFAACTACHRRLK